MSCVDITAPAPRVNYQLLSQYIGKRVAIVGKIEGFEGNALRLRTSDDAMLTVHLQGAVPQAAIVEIEGVVVSPNTINEENICAFSDNFDMSNYNELVKLANSGPYRSLFLP